MSNNLLTTSWLTMESARLLYNDLSISKGFDGSYQKNMNLEFAVGQTIQARLPQRWIGQRSLDWNPEPIDNRTTPITCNKVASIQFEWDSIEKALKLSRSEDYISEELLRPAMNQMAQIIESDASEFAYLNTPNFTGVLGTAFSAMTYPDTARAILVENACPDDTEWRMVLNPSQQAAIKAANATVFNPTEVISDSFIKGKLGKGSGFTWYESMSLYSHTAGNAANAMTVTSTLTNGATSLALTGTTSDILNPGDRITIGSVNAVNPATRRSTGRAKGFVIMDGGTFAASALTVTISPAVYGPGDQYQNVDALPQAGATVTLWTGTSSPATKSGTLALAFQKNAFAIVGAKLEVPTKAEWARSSPVANTPLTVRAVKDWDQRTSKMLFRIDTVYGFGGIYPENCAVVLASN